MLKKCLDQRGFTLTEVIVSVLLLGIVIIPISTLITYNIKMDTKAKSQIIATNIAEGYIEKIKFSEKVKTGEHTIMHDGFVVEMKVDAINNTEDKEENNKYIDKYNLYRITVEIIQNDKVIEKLITYKILNKLGSDDVEVSK